MAVSFTENVPEEDDDEYIDMEITSISNIFCNSRTSREFEFQMQASSTSSPRNLPIGFDSVYGDENGMFREFYGTPLATTITTPTPFESCNVSPCNSCSVSRELNPVEYSFYECWSETDVSRCTGNGQSNRHRRSFSMVIERHSSTNESSTSSSSSSSNSIGFRYLQFLNRSSSVKIKIESRNPIQGAIAHCKRSQMSSRKPAGDVGFYSLSDSTHCRILTWQFAKIKRDRTLEGLKRDDYL
ncbi:probable membrane-associated kinase regulator 4 [Hibiscus syriacus]|uniref:probable membrane-associated kinase regulator 4 n=1 Tax=Hibiscus syriacus TaxID=106335 RepID=UPI001922B3C2|nr:probable membrane-associated kinase regulator 4 [Hibiscus syriacus]